VQKMAVQTTIEGDFLVIRIPLGSVPRIHEKHAISMLTRQTLKVFELLREGKQAKEIAQALNISTRTAKFHISEVYARLGITDGWKQLIRQYGGTTL
jgi:DNA-binding NarL/FixJ family response regulator